MCENEYPGLKENLERFKNDLQDEKTRLLFKIAYKQGYDAGQVDAHCYLPEDFEDFLTEVTDNDGWVFSNGKWRKYGWKSRTTKDLYNLFQRDKNRIGK